jgi:hypothetical protein
MDFCIKKILSNGTDDDLLVNITRILRVLFECKRKGIDPSYYGQIILSKLASCKDTYNYF